MNVAETVRAAQNSDKNAVEELYKNYIGEIKTIAKAPMANQIVVKESVETSITMQITQIASQNQDENQNVGKIDSIIFLR